EPRLPEPGRRGAGGRLRSGRARVDGALGRCRRRPLRGPRRLERGGRLLDARAGGRGVLGARRLGRRLAAGQARDPGRCRGPRGYRRPGHGRRRDAARPGDPGRRGVVVPDDRGADTGPLRTECARRPARAARGRGGGRRRIGKRDRRQHRVRRHDGGRAPGPRALRPLLRARPAPERDARPGSAARLGGAESRRRPARERGPLPDALRMGAGAVHVDRRLRRRRAPGRQSGRRRRARSRSGALGGGLACL
ncbi:MAG: hypothetical protein AVDCRST_MAG38-2531, partial [uncultured Solirubrobacteraceae bacterium]